MTFGVIGTNFISDRFLAALPWADCHATAVFSRKRETGNAFAAKHGIPLVFTSLEDFLVSDAFDAVYIASPNVCHEEQAVRALRAGKHVLCEKPIAPSKAGFLRMQAAAKESGRVLMEAMRPHHDGLWKKIKEHIPQIGQVRSAHLDFCQYSSRYDRYLSGECVNAFDPSLSNAALLDIGIYPIAAAMLLFGPPRTVCGKSVFLPNGFEGAGEAVLDFETHTVSVSYSKVADSAVPSAILGERGSITIDKVSNPTRVLLRLRTGEEIFFTRTDEGAPDNMHEEISAFCHAVRTGTPNPLWHESAAAIAVCDALRGAAGIRFPSDAKDQTYSI